MEETDTQQLVKSQLNYVAMLQNIQPSRCVLIQCTDGDNKPDDGETSADDFNRKWQEWMKIRKHVKAQILTCSVLANELAFDPDVKDWNVMRTEMNKLVSYLKSKNIPHILSWSGGKGAHLEIFLSIPFEITEQLVTDLVKYRIDVWKEIRLFFVYYLAIQSGLDMKAADIDILKIKFNTYKTGSPKDKKGSMIRVLGYTRGDGGYKTIIEEIPEKRPDPGSLPRRFPQGIPMWDVSPFKDQLLAMLQQRVIEAKYVPPTLERTYSRKGYCPGMKAALDGVAIGHRDNTATGLVIALKFWKKKNIVEIEAIMRDWCVKCVPPPDFDLDGISDKISRYATLENKPYSPCTFFTRSGLCNWDECHK